MQDDTTNFFNTLANTRGTNAKMDYVKQNLTNKTVMKLRKSCTCDTTSMTTRKLATF